MRDAIDFGARVFIMVIGGIASLLMFGVFFVAATVTWHGCAICGEPSPNGGLRAFVLAVIWTALQSAMIWGTHLLIRKIEGWISPPVPEQEQSSR